MANQIQLKASVRDQTGKQLVKRLRTAGQIPAVIYGSQIEPINLVVGAKEFELAMRHASGENLLVDLHLDRAGEQGSRLALIQDVQHHPVSDEVLHIDFHEVSATETLRTEVTVRAVGEPVGVRVDGGILEHVLRELSVECLPKDLPDVIAVNIEQMNVEDVLHVSDITPPAGVKFLDEPDQTVFIVAAPITEEQEAALVEGAAAEGEPEVIGEKPAEGEEGAEAEKAGEGKAKAKEEETK